MHGQVNLDFTDNQTYPTRGIRYNISNRIGYNIIANKGIYDQFTADVTLINSWQDISRTIILVKVGGEATLGNISYINYPILGNGNNVRGFANNLIRNSEIAYLNVELRKEIYRSKNRYVPFLLGASGFYDRGLALSNSENNVSGYGGGLYITFLNNAYSLFINKGFNNLNDESIIHYGLGFSL
jgi:hemolysin activation/secretion protein